MAQTKKPVVTQAKESDLFDQIGGLTPVDERALAAFKREMTERVIPEVTRVVEERRILAAESRHRKLEVLIGHRKKR